MFMLDVMYWRLVSHSRLGHGVAARMMGKKRWNGEAVSRLQVGLANLGSYGLLLLAMVPGLPTSPKGHLWKEGV